MWPLCSRKAVAIPEMARQNTVGLADAINTWREMAVAAGFWAVE